jgi:EAL domain-containing protein (putative c-di-GMP-specific phosphodiesterase class I)
MAAVPDVDPDIVPDVDDISPADPPESPEVASAADPLEATTEAAEAAASDARAAAESASDTTLAAGEAAAATAEVARHARVATATAVAAAASSTAQLAVCTAAAVEAEAIATGVDIATSAETARDTIASELPHDADPHEAQEAATAVASAVAEEIVTRSKATADAATVVANAVTAAAEAVFLAAQTTAATVELAADMAAASGRVVADSSAATQAATDVVVMSTSNVVDEAERLRFESLRRVRLARDPLVTAVHQAVVRSELCLHYQPIYEMESGALAAVEALLRWQHPTRGLLAPAEFLHIAESPDLVDPVGDWVLNAAIAQAQAWSRAMGDRAPKIWVNISCEQLGNEHLVGVVASALSRSGLAASSIGIEVTERQLIRQDDEAVADLEALRDLGVSLAVDDFGTGYASLDYLRRFTFDEIKIDRSFVSGLGQDPTDTAVTSSIIALGRSLNLAVVAEGVETQDQHDQLRELGCAMAQGYLMHRPAPPDAIRDLPGGQAI